VNNENVYLCGDYGTIIHYGGTDFFDALEAADFDDNSTVDVLDLNLLMNSFGCLSDCDPYDLNDDGIVNVQDIILFVGLIY